MTRKGFAVTLILCSLIQPLPLFAQSSGKDEKLVGRIVGTVAGAVGGAFLGFMVSDDDARYAERKMARNMVIVAAAGGVGGYFLGRAVDKQFSLSFRDADPVRAAQVKRSLIKSEAARFQNAAAAE